MKKISMLAIAACAAVSGAANAAIQTFAYTAGYHTEAWLAGGSNGASPNVVYGDGPNFGISPQNKCIDGTSVTCASLGYVVGNNGTYQTNVGGANPQAFYSGALFYDDSQTFSWTDTVGPNVPETWYLITGGSLAWTGTYGLEVTVGQPSNGTVGGSFFDYSFANGNVNFTSGARTSTSLCNLGLAGQAIVGALLCGVANPASNYSYANATRQFGLRDNGNGTADIILISRNFTVNKKGNDLQERLNLTQAPVPAAVWMFGSALGVLGAVRRRIKR